MSTITMGSKFPAELAREMFSKVKGHSSLAKMSAEEPIAFAGTDVFVFNFDGSVSIVGETAAKPAGGATVSPVQIRPVKVVYQSRISDEFKYAAEEKQIDYLRKFAEGFSKKIAAGLDVMAMHGVNPATGSASAIIGSNNFDAMISTTKTIILEHNSTKIDANIEEAVTALEADEYAVNGIVLSPAARQKMAAVATQSGERVYPDFAFGATPATLGGATLDVNATVSANSNLDRVILGDFDAFKWGYALDMPLEVIEYGNPDGGTYDLKQANEVLIRSEAFIGWGILDADVFARVKAAGV